MKALDFGQAPTGGTSFGGACTAFDFGVGVFDAETGLSLTSEVPVGTAGIPSTNLLRSAPVVFAADFVDLNPTQAGLLAEFGGSTFGAYAGFLDDGTLSVVCGGNSVANGQAVHRAIGAQGTGTLVISINDDESDNRWRIRVWWNGIELPDMTGLAHASAVAGQWAGSDNGSYMADASAAFMTSSVGTREVGTVLPSTEYGSVSPLRHYANQTVSA